MTAALATLMKPIGPIAEAFGNDWRFINGIMGPVGSGKTTKCIGKMVQSALRQNPHPVDGVYRARWGVIRDTYPQLKKTALASWFAWFPKDMGSWSGEAPFEHTVRLKVFHGARWKVIELTVIFAAIGENKAEDIMRGWELTGLWMNEGDLLAFDVFAYGVGRVGRYPAAKDGGCAWRGVILDMNAPDIENWTYEVFVEKNLGLDAETEAMLKEELGDLFGVGFYVQPGGRSSDPLPENLGNLPKGYYAQQIMAMSRDPHKLRRMVDNEFGPVRNGQPVYPEYNDKIHCADKKLEILKGVPIRLSVDAGLTGAAVFQQRDHRGQIRTIGEVVIFADDEDEVIEQLGATRFGEMCGRYFLDNYPESELEDIAYCDPAGVAGEGARGADPSWRQNFQKGLREQLGDTIRVKPAPVKGNRLDERLEAVRRPMRQLVEGGEPAYIICPVRCPKLRKGFKGAYVWKRSGSNMAFKSEPDKGPFSHVHDANQYGCVSYAKAAVRAANQNHHPEARSPRKPLRANGTYNVHRGR